MRLGLLIALWKRPRLTRFVLEQWDRVRLALRPRGVDLVPLVVTTPGDPQHIPSLWRRQAYSNEPVSNKHNAGLRAMRTLRLEAVMVSGSDDLVSIDWVRYAAERIQEGYDVVQHVGLYVYDQPSGRMLDLPLVNTGVGRTFSCDILEAVGWELWIPGRNRVLDNSVGVVLEDHLCPRWWHLAGHSAGPVMDIKTEEGGLTDLSFLEEHAFCLDCDAGDVFRREFPDEADRVLHWNHELEAV